MKIPKGVAWWLGLGAEWVGWLTGKETVISRGLVADGTAVRYVSIAKARTVLGYVPRVGMEEGLRISCQVCIFLK